MEYTIKTEYREPFKVDIEFDSVEELKAAQTIVTLYNFNALYKLITSISNWDWYKESYTLDGIKVIEPKLALTTLYCPRLTDELERLGNYLRRSYGGYNCHGGSGCSSNSNSRG